MQQQQQQPDPFAQQYGGGGGAARPSASRGNNGVGVYATGGAAGYSEQQSSSNRRFNLPGGSDVLGDQQQQMHMHGGGGMGGGDLMGNISQRSHHSQQQQGYRGDPQSNSPGNPNAMSRAHYGGGGGGEQLSPTNYDHRMSLGFYPMSGGSAASPNFATMGDPMDFSGRGLPSAAPPALPGGSATQADREEELLLNLLIARRQRGRMTGDGRGGRSQASLADDLMRLRQSRAASASGQQRSGSIPQMPGMPPLYTDSMPSGSVIPPNMYPGSTMDAYHRGASMKAEAALPPHHQMRQAEVSERIDRSPGRFQMTDARMSEMREMSERAAGFKRGMGSMGMGSGMGMSMGMGMPMGYDNSGFNYPLSLEEMAPPAKKKRTHKKKPADMVRMLLGEIVGVFAIVNALVSLILSFQPRRPLSAYNLFFSEERERILKEIEVTEGKSEGGGDAEEKTAELNEDVAKDSDEEKPKALLRPIIPSQKKRRPHRKTHGKISFQQLARMVGERWKSLSEDKRTYYQDLAQEDMKRQKLAMEEYYAKQNDAKLKSGDTINPSVDEASDLQGPSYAGGAVV